MVGTYRALLSVPQPRRFALTALQRIALKVSSLGARLCALEADLAETERTFTKTINELVCRMNKGLSDHAPCDWRVSVVSAVASQFQPIPSFITRSCEFKNVAAKLVACANLDSLSKLERLDVHKEILLEAAKLARDQLNDKHIYA